MQQSLHLPDDAREYHDASSHITRFDPVHSPIDQQPSKNTTIVRTRDHCGQTGSTKSQRHPPLAYTWKRSEKGWDTCSLHPTVMQRNSVPLTSIDVTLRIDHLTKEGLVVADDDGRS